MHTLYKIFVTVHKAVIHLYSFQQQCIKTTQTLKDIHVVIMHVHEWTMRYNGPPLYFHKMMKMQAELDKVGIQILIRNYEHLHPLITSIEASYAMLCRSLDVIVRTHNIPSIRTLTQAMRKNQVMLEVKGYIEQLMCKATNDDLKLSTENMQKYIGGPTTLRIVLRVLQDELDRGFRTIYLEAMEARVCFSKMSPWGACTPSRMTKLGIISPPSTSQACQRVSLTSMD